MPVVSSSCKAAGSGQPLRPLAEACQPSTGGARRTLMMMKLRATEMIAPTIVPRTCRAPLLHVSAWRPLVQCMQTVSRASLAPGRPAAVGAPARLRGQPRPCGAHRELPVPGRRVVKAPALLRQGRRARAGRRLRVVVLRRELRVWQRQRRARLQRPRAGQPQLGVGRGVGQLHGARRRRTSQRQRSSQPTHAIAAHYALPLYLPGPA